MSTITYEEVLGLFKETDRKFQDTDRKFQETREQMKEADRKVREQMKETDRQIKALGRQIGGLGNKFGSFAEGISLPALEKLLAERFGMEHINQRMRVRRGGVNIEFDMVAWSNGEKNTAVLVEIKSHPREEAIEQLIAAMQKFRQFFPEHRGKKLYGLIAGIDWSHDVKRAAQEQGIYTASFTDDALVMDTPDNFQAQAW
jgi:hypothetical protein